MYIVDASLKGRCVLLQWGIVLDHRPVRSDGPVATGLRVDTYVNSHVDTFVDSYVDSCVDSCVDSRTASYVYFGVDTYVNSCVATG